MQKRTRLFILTIVIFSLFIGVVPSGNLASASYNKQAIEKAEDYLRVSSFSRKGLIEQLEYSGFSYDEAAYAVDATNTNWKDQAIKKAKDYLDVSAFSREGLIDQLEYSGFTKEEAVYGTDAINANWKDQALKKAQDYLDVSAFSREGLIDQLEYSGFTNEEAIYGADSTNTNWKDQAIKKAQDYLKLSSFSRSRLISQLEYSGFTNEEAIYGADVALGNIDPEEPEEPEQPEEPEEPEQPEEPEEPEQPEDEIEDEDPVDKPKKQFKDLGNHEWAREAIEAMAGEGIINGVSANEFDPSSNIKRGDFVTLIARLLDLDGGNVQALPFTDVAGDKYYSPSIAAVYEKGLINGRTETSFDPEGFITREEMSKIIGTIIMENVEITVDRDVLSKFTDNNSISSWAKDSASVVVDQKIIEGSDNMFKPKDNATRAETAVMLYRLKNNIL